MDLRLGSYIDSLGWFVENQHLGIRRPPARERHFLLVASRQISRPSRNARRLDGQLASIFFCEFFLSCEPQPTAWEQTLVHRHRHIARDRHFRNDPVPSPILRHITDSCTDRVLRASNAHLFSLQEDGSGICRRDTKKYSRQLCPACSYQSRQSQNFSASQFEGHVANPT